MKCRSLLILGALGGCADSSPPLLYIDATPDGTALSVELARDPGYDFSDTHASLNGVDLGSAQVDEGANGKVFTGDGGRLASATWQIAFAQIGTSAHLVVQDGGDIVVDLPTIGAQRTATLTTPLTAPLAPGSSLAATTGVASDIVTGSFIIEQPDGSPCMSPGPDQSQPGGGVSVTLDNPALVEGEWSCGAVPAAGTLFHGTLDLILDVTPELAQCTGDGVTCESVTIPQLETTMPVELQF